MTWGECSFRAGTGPDASNLRESDVHDESGGKPAIGWGVPQMSRRKLVYRHRAIPWLVVLVLVGSTTILVSPGGLGATTNTIYGKTRVNAPDPQVEGRSGERTATVKDLDGDGVNDFFMAAPNYDDGARADTGIVYAMSGKTRKVLYRIRPPQPQSEAKFGFFISVPGDLDADRKKDVVVGTDAQDVYTGEGARCGEPEPNGCNENQGKAWVFSGADGKLLYPLDNPAPQGTKDNTARFGSRIGRAGDLNGDSVSEIIVGASNNDVPAGCGDSMPVPPGCRKDEGEAFIFDGKTGKLFRTLNLPQLDQIPTCPAACGSFGIAVQGPGDTNDDGITDHYVNAASYAALTGRSYVFSGKDGELLLRIDNPDPQPIVLFGFQDAEPLAPGDVNGDGFDDLYANGFLQDGDSGQDEGRAWVFSGKDGEVLYELRDPTPEEGGQFGWSLAGTDYNKDRTPDLYIGQSPHHTPGAKGFGGTYVFNGKDGSLLKTLELPKADRQESTADNLGPNLGWTVAAPGDLNGDAEPDFLAGAPFLDVGENKDQGALYVFHSRIGSTCTIVGNKSDEVLRGTSGNDIICGRGGNDVLKGHGGNDILRGGTGNDTLRGARGRDLLKGQRGNDNLFGGRGRDICRGGPGRDRKRGC